MEPFLEAMHWRYAVKKFDASRTVEAAHLKTILDATRLAPSSFGLQPYQIIVLSRGALTAQLPAISWNQSQPNEASHVLVFCARTQMDSAYIDHYLDEVSATRHVPRESLDGYRKMMIGSASQMAENHAVEPWTRAQTYLALGVAIATAAQLRVDSCPMEGIDKGAYAKLLGLEGTPFIPEVILPLGYRANDDHYAQLAKVRLPEDELIVMR